jgi:hypothetical protein
MDLEIGIKLLSIWNKVEKNKMLKDITLNFI